LKWGGFSPDVLKNTAAKIVRWTFSVASFNTETIFLKLPSLF
jgi:hypothetical protein